MASDSASHLRGIIASLLALFLFACQDAITKHLMSSLHITQILFVRYSFFLLFAILLSARSEGIGRALRARRPWLQIVRGLLIVFEMAVYAYALHYLGLAPTNALFITFPIIVTVLSVPILGETVGWRRWLAVIGGFIGTLLIIKPGFGVFHPAALIALLAALMFALYNTLTRLASRQDSSASAVLYFGLVGFVASSLSAPFHWQPPSGEQIAWLLTISTTGIIGHYLLIRSLALAPATLLQPFNYTILLWALLLGWLLFGEVLDGLSLAGAALIAASGLWIAWREYRRSRSTIAREPAGT